MSEISDEEGDIFDHVDSIESEDELKVQNEVVSNGGDINNVPDQEIKINIEKELEDHNPLPILQGVHSLGPDMKFGWKPDIDFQSAPIPLYFNFVEHPMQTYYEEQAYYQNTNGVQQSFKIIYYGPRFKDSFEMHKNFVKPLENTYEFNFPKFYGLASAKAFYDSVFEDMMDGEAPRRDEMREFLGMCPEVDQNELYFNSNFENGNLDMVVKTGENNYDLFLRVDSNTRGHFNWFHFEVGKTKKNRTVQFNIVNLSKRDSLFNHGMQINYWSQMKNQPSFCGWQRGGQNIRYTRSKINNEGSKKQKNYYTLSFEFTFEHDNDKIWFAYTIPYSYSMLTQYIKSIAFEQKNRVQLEKLNKHTKSNKSSTRKGIIFQDSVLCKSLGGVDVPLLTITNFSDHNWQKNKKVVFIQARIHPGETSSSWIIHGLISFLTSKSKVANRLRRQLVFKIIPMCNPDGVIIGNSRTTLIGRDMNRQYQTTNGNEEEDEKLNPIPNAIKTLIQQLIKDDKDKIFAFWDLHQHSKKKSIFIYGPYYPLHTDKYLKIRIIPKLLSERSEMFRFFSCRFKNDKYKESCARMTIGRQFNIVNCFTLECSSYGYITKDRTTIQFREDDLIEFGKNMCQCLQEYIEIMDRDQQIKEEISERMQEKKKKRKALLPQELQENSQEKPIIRSEQDDNTDSQDSESSYDGSDDDSNSIEDQNREKQRKSKSTNSKQNLESPDKIDEVDSSEEEDKYYSEEEDANDGNSSPVSRPNELKGLLKHKQKAQKTDQKSNDKKTEIRTLDHLLTMIQNDIIQEEEEEFSNDDKSNQSIGTPSSNYSSDQDEDDLDFQDQQIIKDRILHAIQVFSRYSPNPKKDILRRKRQQKLSIENKSRASSRRSNRSDSKRSSKSGDPQNEGKLTPKSPLLRVKKNQYANNKSLHTSSHMQNPNSLIDSFLKEVGIMNNNNNGKVVNLNNKDLDLFDDDVLSQISSELIKSRKKRKKNKRKKGSVQNNLEPQLLMVKSFGTAKAVTKMHNQSQDNHNFSSVQMNAYNALNNQDINSPNNSMIVGSARKVILQKYNTNNGSSETPSNKGNTMGQVYGAIGQNRINQQQRQDQVNKMTQQRPFTQQKIQNFGFQDWPSNPQNPKGHQKNVSQDVQTSTNEKLTNQTENDNKQKDSHLLGHDRRFALLNQAIFQKKQVSHHVRYNSYQPPRPQTQMREIRITNRISINDIQKVIKIPQISGKQKQMTQPSSQTKIQGQHQLNNNQSLESVMPSPLISCKIQPIQPQNKSNQRNNRNQTRSSQRNQSSMKVNAATDTMNHESLDPNKQTLNIMSRQVEVTDHRIFSDQSIKIINDTRSIGYDEHFTIPNPKNMINSISDHSIMGITSNIYDQRQIISSQSKASQLQLEKIRQSISIPQSTLQQSIQMPQQYNSRPFQVGGSNNYHHQIVNNENPQIGLHQWMKLQQQGIIKDEFLMVTSNNQDYIRPRIKFNSQYQTSIGSLQNSQRDYSDQALKQKIRIEKRIKQRVEGYKNEVLNDIKIQQVQSSNFNRERPQQTDGHIVKGRAKSQIEPFVDIDTNLVIKNQVKPQQTRYKMFNHNPGVLEYFEKNKSQIVKEILLKSGNNLLNDYSDQPSIRGSKQRMKLNVSLI